MSRFIEMGTRAQDVISQAFRKSPDKSPVESVEAEIQEEEVILSVESAEKAAETVFNRLVDEVTEGSEFVEHIRDYFDSETYDAVDVGNALLSYGRLSARWVEPDDPNTHRALHRGLQTFGVELSDEENQPEGQLEMGFVEALGELVSNYTAEHGGGEETSK